MNISVIIIAKNEEKQIKNCMQNLSFAQEIILVDNQSSDQTASIARLLGAKVVEVKGLDFSYFRNVGKEKAKSDWLFYLDADEKVSGKLASEIKNRLMEEKMDAYELIRQNYYFGSLCPKTERMIRIIKKNSLIGWQGGLHETAIVTGNVGCLASPLLHYTHNKLQDMVVKTNEWSQIEARLRYKNNHPKMTWWRFFRVITYAFWNSYIRQECWKMGTIGLIESIYQSFSIFITYAKLYELQNMKYENRRS